MKIELNWCRYCDGRCGGNGKCRPAGWSEASRTDWKVGNPPFSEGADEVPSADREKLTQMEEALRNAEKVGREKECESTTRLLRARSIVLAEGLCTNISSEEYGNPEELSKRLGEAITRLSEIKTFAESLAVRMFEGV